MRESVVPDATGGSLSRHCNSQTDLFDCCSVCLIINDYQNNQNNHLNNQSTCVLARMHLRVTVVILSVVLSFGQSVNIGSQRLLLE